MAQTVLIKRSTTTDVPSSLDNGELAYSSSSNKLFIGRPGGAAGDVDAIGGKYYTDFIDSLYTTGSGNLTGDVTGTLSYDIVNGTISGTTSIAEQTYYADDTNVQFHVPSDSYKVAGDTNAIDTSITKSGTAVTLTVDHKDLLASGTADQSYGSTTAIPVLTVNAQGHVTSINSTSISTTLSISDDNDDTGSVALASDTLKFAGGTYLSSDVSVDGTTDIITFSHDATTRSDATSAASVRSGQNFTAVDSVTTNSEGHVTAVNVKTVTLADTLDTVTDAGNTTDNDISVGDLTVRFTGPQPDYANIKDSRSTVLFNNLDAAGNQRDVASITGVSTDNGGNGELVFSTYYSGTRYDNVVINGNTNSTTFIGQTTQGVDQNVKIDADGYYPKITFNGSTEGDLTTQDSQYIDNRKISIWDDAAAFTHTLDTVTDNGNTTDNNIQVNDIRVNGGNITGPATITIDPDATGVTGTVIIAGDLTVQGTTTTINSTTVEVGDNILVLNKDASGVPGVSAGFEVERGDYVNVSLEWNEADAAWQVSLPNIAQDAVVAENLVTDVNFEALITTIDGGTF